MKSFSQVGLKIDSSPWERSELSVLDLTGNSQGG